MCATCTFKAGNSSEIATGVPAWRRSAFKLALMYCSAGANRSLSTTYVGNLSGSDWFWLKAALALAASTARKATERREFFFMRNVWLRYIHASDVPSYTRFLKWLAHAE